MEADHQKKLFKALFETVGGWVGVQSPKLSLSVFKASFFNLYMGDWVVSPAWWGSSKCVFIVLASLVPRKQGAYLLPLCSTTQVQKWTKGWVSCSLWAAMIQTGCRVSRCSLRTLEMWHFQLQLHFSKKYIKCVKQATSNSESPRKVLSSCIILLKHDMRPSFLNCQISRPKILHRKCA